MTVKNCLILSAGLGTRMGEIGKYLPKSLWPVFGKKLIELQIYYAKKMGCEKIFINSHHLNESVKSFLAELEDDAVTLVYEKELLDVGGAIHNIANNYLNGGKLLVLNADLFFFIEEKVYLDACRLSDEFVTILFAINVDKSEKYNRIITSNEKLIDIVQHSDVKKDNYQTFSGVSIINLDLLEKSTGKSKYFDTVAKYKDVDVKIVSPNYYEYWDFGTIDRYWTSMFNLLKSAYFKINDKNYLKSNRGLFVNFCLESNAIRRTLVSSENTYNGYGNYLINLSGKSEIDIENSIIISCIKSKVRTDRNHRCIIRNEICEFF